MQIRQLALHYVREADRLLWRINTSDGQLIAIWLTRRLTLRLWPHLTQMITQLAVQRQLPQAQPNPTLLPEARDMLNEAARENALRKADFKTPFDSQPRALPLGSEPMLAVQVRLVPLPEGLLRLLVTDTGGRNVQLQLSDELAIAVRELLVRALTEADWGWTPPSVQPAEAAGPDAPRILN